MPDWMVARVFAHAERKVCDRLRKIDVENYRPRYRIQIFDRRTHRKRYVVKSLFPNYVFVKTSMFYGLLEIGGIYGFVMAGEFPARSSSLDASIENLRDSEDDEGLVHAPLTVRNFKFKHNDKLRILRGPLQNVVAKCSGYDELQVIVDVLLMGRSIGVRYNECDLAAA